MQLGTFLKVLFPPKPTYSPNDIPDLSGKTVIVTGGNTGIGYATAKELLAHNAKVYIAARSSEKTQAAIEKLKSETDGKEAIFLQLDLSDLHAVKRAAEEFTSKENQLHILFNNAGVMALESSSLTKDGYDLQFGTNVLGHFYFTKLLLPTLQSTAAALPPEQKGDVRIVNVSSAMIYTYWKQDIMWSTLKDGPARNKTFLLGILGYPQSKLGNAIMANEFARRYGEDGIVSMSCHPGVVNSELYRFNGLTSWFMSKVSYDVWHGSLTQLWAGTSEEGRKFNGEFLVPWARVGKHATLAMDEAAGKALWEWCEDQVSNM